ncbi:MAG: tRNA (adenosine(37)-N6)-threonylcarbamoyltransferase complex transferase subunit TsaD [Rickettsiales bacterium]|jgi:tRNA threonylcarbamoyl adenosine modification protein TsaD|nr:tRNA (adenosine(37)-N6)-threonylcarbamoyltransferase complex transferase subunit TsaD [Rickettsiales bacterium]
MVDKKNILCLGIESSCDETAAAIVDANGRIISHTIYSQIPEHQRFGGVVPELAARAHILAIDEVVKKTLGDAALTLDDIDVVAATAGPGLIGGVIVGWEFASGLAMARGLPLVAVNHLEGHALACQLAEGEPVDFPYLLLLASGGHSQILVVRGVGKYELLGETLDDSAGESFDKVAKMLGLGYPGGPAVERAAATGRADAFDFPRPLCNQKNCDFSFSGIKTAARTILDKMNICGIVSDDFSEYENLADLREMATIKYKRELSTADLFLDGIGKVRFSKKGLDKYKSCSANPDKLKSICIIPSIIKNGRYTGFSESYKQRADGIVGFHRYVGNVVVSGKLITEEILIGQDKFGGVFYNMNVLEEKEPAAVSGYKSKLTAEISVDIIGRNDANVKGGFVSDFCAAFQAAVIDVILNRLENAIARAPDVKTMVVAGGVAANKAIRAAMERLAAAHGMRFAAPPLKLCTDNGAMIAWAGIRNFAAGNIVREPVAPRPRWPLAAMPESIQ